jgi:hypothetical protein
MDIKWRSWLGKHFILLFPAFNIEINDFYCLLWIAVKLLDYSGIWVGLTAVDITTSKLFLCLEIWGLTEEWFVLSSLFLLTISLTVKVFIWNVIGGWLIVCSLIKQSEKFSQIKTRHSYLHLVLGTHCILDPPCSIVGMVIPSSVKLYPISVPCEFCRGRNFKEKKYWKWSYVHIPVYYKQVILKDILWNFVLHSLHPLVVHCNDTEHSQRAEPTTDKHTVVDMQLYIWTHPRFQVNQFFLLLNGVVRGEKIATFITILSYTCWIEPSIVCHEGVHAYHHTIYAKQISIK